MISAARGFFTLCLVLVSPILFSSAVFAQNTAVRKIVLIAGPMDSHPENSHEYEKNIILLKECLDNAPALKGKIQTEVYFNGWPENPAVLESADTIFLTSAGGDHNEKDHPLYVGERFVQLEKQMKRGCGVVFYHWTTFHPSRVHDQITEWVGGYFDYQTGTTPNKWYSTIQTKEWQTVLPNPDHPIARGVKPFKVTEEFYFKTRFRENDPRLVPILLNEADGNPLEKTVGWAVERKDGGRGFGFTGGHFYDNWWLPDFRKLIVNAVAWTAKLDIPAGGIETTLDSKIRALILTGNNHPAHEWRSVTEALIHTLEQDPRMLVDVTENPEDLATRLKNYQLLVLNYVNWEKPGLSEAAKTGLTQFVSNGGGLSVIHFANGAFHYSLPKAEDSEWPEFRKMVLRVWDHKKGSMHDNYGPFRVEFTPEKHPITQGLVGFETEDELYFNQAGEEKIIPLATAKSKITNKDEPMAWVHQYGSGKIFQTVLGHAAISVKKAAPLIRRGSVWAAQRKPLSFDPPSTLLEKAFLRPGSPWTPQQSLKPAPAPAPQAANPAPAANTALVAAKSAPSSTGPAEDLKKKLLPANEGLEGGQGGHWGIKGEKDWADNRWNQMEVGEHQASILPTPHGEVAKGLTVRLGEAGEASVNYNTATMTLRAAWTGGFLQFDPARYGVISSPRPQGTLKWASPTINEGLNYLGFYRSGKRLVFEYEKDGVAFLESPWFEKQAGGQAFTRQFQVGPSAKEVKRVLYSLSGGTPNLQNQSVTLEGPVKSIVATAGILQVDGPQVLLVLPPSAQPREFVVAYALDSADPAAIRNSLAEKKTIPLRELAKGGPARWPEKIKAVGQLGLGTDAYLLDTIPVPYQNPWKALMFLTGIDFLENGNAAISTLHGDVWIVSGIDDKLQNVEWKRFATGLFQPLGLRVFKNNIYVLGRDQITRLEDLNGDGEADAYRNFSNLIKTSVSGHDYVSCLEVDPEGGFYFVDPLGVHRISPDGKKLETIATGWRNPNGMSLGPRGEITVAPQEGEWTPASMISEVKRGGFYGYGGPKVIPNNPVGYDQHLCYLPRLVDNSTGSQVWSTSPRWGPLDGQLLNLSFGRSSMQLILRDTVNGTAQGGIVPLKLRFLSGAMRGTFRKQDGQLYVVGSQGWVSNALKDGSFQRVRYTGQKIYLPVGFEAYQNGIQLTFTQPLKAEVAQDPGSWGLEQWNYKYAAAYGSQEYSLRFPDQVGHDPIEVKAVRLSADGKKLFLETEPLKPVHQLAIKYNLNAADGKLMKGELYLTLHKLRNPTSTESRL